MMKTWICVLAMSMICVALSSQAATVVWDGSTDTDWSGSGDATSWTGGVTYTDGDTAQFNGAGAGTVNITANVAPGSISVNDGGANYTFAAGGGVITGGSTLTKDGTGTLTINTANTYTGGTTLTNGTLTVNNSSAVGSGTLTLAGGTLRTDTTGATLSVPIVASGTTAVVAGLANLTLTGDISGAGTLNISGGSGERVRFDDDLAGFTGTISFDNSSGNWLDFNGANKNTTATLETSGNGSSYIRLWRHSTFGELSGTSGRIGGDNRFLTINQGTDTTYGGVLQDVNGARELGLTKGGTGRLTLTNTGNSYEWATTINGGTLEVQGRLTETVSITVAGGATFEVTGSGSLGSGGVYENVGGTANPGTIANSGTFNYNSTTDQELPGVISGAGVLVKDNTSTLTLTAANTYSGATTVSNGTLKIDGAGQLGSGSYAGTISNSGTLEINSSAAQTLSGVISGAGALVKDGTGQLNLSVNNSFTGGVTVNDGILGLENGAIGANGPLTVNGGLVSVSAHGGFDNLVVSELSGTGGLIDVSRRRLTVDQAADTTYAGVIQDIDGVVSSGNGTAFTKSGSGTLTLSGNNTYSKNTTVSGGTLEVSGALYSGGTHSGSSFTVGAAGTLDVTGAGSLGSGAVFGVNIANSGTINYNSTTDQTLSGIVSGTGALTQNGTGTLTLSAASTYSGGTDILGGTLDFRNDSAMGTARIDLGGGGVLQFGVDALNLSEAVRAQNDAGNKIIRLDLTGANTGTLSGQLDIRRSAAGEFDIDVGTDDTLTVSSAIVTLAGGGAGLTKEGAGTLRIAHNCTHSGNVMINAGKLQINNSGGTGSWTGGLIYINNGSTLEFTGSGQVIMQDASDNITFDSNGGGSMVMTKNTIWRNATIITTGGSQNTVSGTHFNGQNSSAYRVIYNVAVGTDDIDLQVSSNHDNSGGITKHGAGTLAVTHTVNDITGGGVITINDGVLEVGGSGRIDSGSYADNIVINGDAATLFRYNSTANQTLSGVISGAGSLEKDNTGTLTLSGANTYAGDTTVSNGTLLVNNSSGSGTGSGAVNVSSAATLGGTGSMSGLVTVNNGGHVAPGTSIGTLTMSGGLTLSDGSVLDFEVDPGGTGDRIDITGGTFTGSSAASVTVNVSMSGALTETVTYTLIDWSAASAAGVDLSDFSLVYSGSDVVDLSFVGDTLVLSASPAVTLFKFK